MSDSNPNRREFATATALALGWLASSSCSRTDPTGSQARRPLRIAVDLWPGYFPLLIAARQGRFAQRGLEVEIDIPENTGRILASFAARSHDAICVALGDLVNVAQKNPDVRIVMVTDQSDGGDQLIAREPYAAVADLERARIGINLYGFGELLVRAFAERVGVAFETLNLVDVDAADVPEMLALGEIDVGHTWEPYAARLLGRGYHAWFTSRDVRGLIPACLAFQKRFIDERRSDVAALLASWQDALDWWREHHDEGLALAAEHPEVGNPDFSLRGIALVDRAENRRIFAASDAPDAVLAVTRRYVEHFGSRGMLARPPRPEELIDPSFTESW